MSNTTDPQAFTGDRALRWCGRVERAGAGARFGWPGCGFLARFAGTSARARITTVNPDYFELVIDGRSSLLITQPGTHEYDLATDLDPAPHTLSLHRRTESFNGTIVVEKVSFGSGSLLPPPPLSNKRLEVIGDSISAGYGVECNDPAVGFSYATENHYKSYAAIAARELGAELMTMAWSGIGMYRSHDGWTEDQMPVIYPRTIAIDKGSAWDFSAFEPGAVIIHLGTNDFAQGDPGPRFVATYLDFAASVRRHYPSARMYCALSPMLPRGSRVRLASYLAEVVSTRRGAGDGNVAVIEVARPSAEEGWACDYHPSAATHVTMARLLARTLEADLGW
ncbi:MAG TPA: GDSL-type esterase/lipase family protein [Polyangiaceae bacterium]|nr:GDSL-type esterase/lipase family protein [Polyangiaceae bacterium]